MKIVIIFILFLNCSQFQIKNEVKISTLINKEDALLYGRYVQFFSLVEKKEYLTDFIPIRNKNIYSEQLKEGLKEFSDKDDLVYFEISNMKDNPNSVDDYEFLINNKRVTNIKVFKENLFLLDNGTIEYEYVNLKEVPLTARRRGLGKSHLFKEKLMNIIFVLKLNERNNNQKLFLKVITPNKGIIELAEE
ncbi:MAG: hypothetical protein SFU98_05560 [Leptospiraceae bacterium]|nr:hypothetical protein [Leptospiraceae bacterium]